MAVQPSGFPELITIIIIIIIIIIIASHFYF